jgi:folate-dependent phosphoribosylglycinamide formyltransferase PurN
VRWRILSEQPISRLALIRRRREKLGSMTVAGQLAFQALVQPVLRRRARARIAMLERRFGLDTSPPPGELVQQVDSANSPACHAALRALRPRVVVLAGTRILSERTLAAVPATFLNMHMGITPAYRGVHGGYWALAQGRPDLVGTTVHVVDAGVDTGEVVEQTSFAPEPEDDFATYPTWHLGTGLPALERAVRAALNGTLTVRQGVTPALSRLHYHPTILGYAKQALLRGVR